MKKTKCSDIPKELWPPKDAIEEELDVYRLTRQKEVIIDSDFISLYEIDKNKGIVKQGLLNDDKYYALSVYEDIDDAISTMKKFPQKFKDICKGKTIADEGCIRVTPTASNYSHRSWWLYEGANPLECFSIMEGIHE